MGVGNGVSVGKGVKVDVGKGDGVSVDDGVSVFVGKGVGDPPVPKLTSSTACSSMPLGATPV